MMGRSRKAMNKASAGSTNAYGAMRATLKVLRRLPSAPRPTARSAASAGCKLLVISPHRVVVDVSEVVTAVTLPYEARSPPRFVRQSAPGDLEALALEVGDAGRLHPAQRVGERSAVLDRLLELGRVGGVRDVDVGTPVEAAGRPGDGGCLGVEVRLVRHHLRRLLEPVDTLARGFN